MAHFIFIILHICALIFGVVGLVLTIPLHIIYSAISSKGRARSLDAVNSQTHVHCPACREFVLADASKCKHCGTALVPQATSKQVESARRVATGQQASKFGTIMVILIAALIVYGVVSRD